MVQTGYITPTRWFSDTLLVACISTKPPLGCNVTYISYTPVVSSLSAHTLLVVPLISRASVVGLMLSCLCVITTLVSNRHV